MSKNNDSFMNPPAFARVQAGASPTFLLSRGFASVTRPALGRHIVTLTEAMPTNAMMAQITREASTHGSVGYSVSSTTTIDVYTFDSTGAAADTNFTIGVSRNGF